MICVFTCCYWKAAALCPLNGISLQLWRSWLDWLVTDFMKGTKIISTPPFTTSTTTTPLSVMGWRPSGRDSGTDGGERRGGFQGALPQTLWAALSCWDSLLALLSSSTLLSLSITHFIIPPSVLLENRLLPQVVMFTCTYLLQACKKNVKNAPPPSKFFFWTSLFNFKKCLYILKLKEKHQKTTKNQNVKLVELLTATSGIFLVSLDFHLSLRLGNEL